MTKKPYILIGAVASAAILLTGCELVGDESNLFSPDNAAYSQNEIQMMVTGILKNHTKQPQLSAEKVIKYQLASDSSNPKKVDVSGQFAYKLASDNKNVKSLAANFKNGAYGYVYDGTRTLGTLTEEQNNHLNKLFKENIKNSNEVLNMIIVHISNALSADVEYKENGEVLVIYNISNYIQENSGSFDETLAYVKVLLNKDYELLSAKEVMISEVGEEITYSYYDITNPFENFSNAH